MGRRCKCLAGQGCLVRFLTFEKDLLETIVRPRHNSFVALKILSGYGTRLNKEEKLRESICLSRLASLPPESTSHCPLLLDHFYHPGIEQDGEHLCLALRLEQTTLGAAWPKQGGLPVPLVKRILRHVLHGLSAIHSCGIAHTGMSSSTHEVNC